MAGFQNFGKAFKNPGTGDWETALDATREIISGCQDIIGEVGDSKIGLPYTGEEVIIRLAGTLCSIFLTDAAMQ